MTEAIALPKRHELRISLDYFTDELSVLLFRISVEVVNVWKEVLYHIV